MDPWSTDAGDINPDKINKSYIVTNSKIDRFLKVGEHDRKLFLVGPKGTGKSLLIRYKAYKYFNDTDYKGYLNDQTTGNKEIVESLNLNLITLKGDDIKHLANYENWVNIWGFALSLFILRKTNIGLPEKYKKFDKLFPLYFGLGDIVTELLNDSSEYVHSDFFLCINHLQSRLRLIQSGYALFIDRLDQGLNTFLKNPEYDYLESKKVNYPYEVWKGAQFALMVAIYNINSAVNSHIKIFATARTEALEVVDSTLKQNVVNYSIELNYNKKELREMFINNIKLIPKENQIEAYSNNWFKKYLGFDVMEHLIAKDDDGNQREELSFDFICRHSFERPRQIMKLGGKNYDELVTREGYKEEPLNAKVELVRKVVNDSAHFDIFGDYKSEIVPYFHDEIITKFSQSIQQNVIPRREIELIDSDSRFEI